VVRSSVFIDDSFLRGGCAIAAWRKLASGPA
jgi:hypothetical protein